MKKIKAIDTIDKVLGRLQKRRDNKKIALRKSFSYSNGSRTWTASYELSEPNITSRTVMFKYTPSRFVIPATLPRGFVSMDGRALLNKPPVARITRTHSILGDLSKVKHWYIKTTHGFAIFHKESGTVQVSGKSIGIVAKQLERVCPGISSASNIRVVKFDAEMYVNKLLRLENITRASPRECTYEPELRNAMVVTWSHPAMKLVVYTGGKVQIFGASKPKQAVDVMRQLIERATPVGAFKRKVAVIHGTMEYLGYSNKPMKSKTRNEKLANLRTTKLNSRHPIAENGYATVPNAGKYVRPGPNGKPRMYNVKGNMRLSAKKITTAYQKAGVNMPQYVKNMIGSTFVVYGASSGAKMAKTWNNRLNGHYIAPGAGRQPYFYKLPKNLKSGYVTAKKRYTEAGMSVPKHVQNLFGVTNGNFSGMKHAMNHTVQNNKVNGKSYRKLTKEQLVSVARNLNNAGASVNMSKNVLFQRIKSKATIKPKSPPMEARKPNVTVGGRTYIFSNDPLNQRIVRNGHKRVFDTLPKNERTAIMNTYFRGNGYKVYKPKDWYTALRVYKGVRPATPASSPSTTNEMRNLERELLNAMTSPNKSLNLPKNIP
jgi:hypothetical protein